MSVSSSESHYTLRHAVPGDAEAIAALHADSWRRHYRGAYTDEYLEGDLEADRQQVWTQRLATPGRSLTVVLHDESTLVGFAHTVLDNDPTWGSLLENLHVAHNRQRQGLGRRLLTAAAVDVDEHATHHRLHLWVLEQNVRAQQFYRALGGEPVEESLASPPGGVAERLHGHPRRYRYAWLDARTLTTPTPGE